MKFIYEILKYLPYPDIVSYCGTNVYLHNICQADEYIKGLITNKKVEYVKHKKLVTKIYHLVNSGYGGSAIVEYSADGKLDYVDELLKYNISEYYTDMALRTASRYKNVEIVNRLQDPRVNPASDNNQAIRNASVSGHLNVVNRLLQDPRVNPTIYDNEAVKLAYRNGHQDVVNRLLQEPGVHL